MKFRLFSLAAVAMISFAGCSHDIIPQETEDGAAAPRKVQSIVPGKAIIYISDELAQLVESDLAEGNLVTKSSELNSLSEMIGVQSMERLFPHAGKFETRTRAEGLHKWYKVTYDPDVPVTKASDGLASIPGIEIVEPVRNIRNTAIFDDPKFGSQWHYYNTGALDKSHKAGADVNVMPVWENYTKGNPDVIVAVVDGGIDYTHEDLKDNYIGGFNFCRNTAKIVPHDHGTHVAGTIAAVNNNGLGVAGLAGGDAKNGVQGVKLLSCQIFEPNPDDPDHDLGGDGALAIKWGADNGAVISQNSWGYVFETDEEQANATIPPSVKAAIDYFIQYAGYDENGNQDGPMAGGVVIFAAGNDARAHDPIGKYEPVISVGAMSPDFTRTYYSNYGDWVDLAAPGGSVDYSMGQVLSTLPGSKYGYMQGTSMACPHVSGVAALVVSHFAGPGFTNTTLKEKLLNGANQTAVAKNARIGKLVDAFGAMTYGGTIAPEKVASAVVVPVSNTVNLTWEVPSDKDDRKAYGFMLLASRNKSTLSSPLDYNALPADVVRATVMTGDLKAGDEISGTVAGLEFEQEYHVAIVAFDYNRNWSDLSPLYTVTTEGNNPPEVRTDYTGSYAVKSHEVLKVLYEIADPDGHSVTVTFVPGSEGVAWEQIPDGRWQMTVTGNVADPGVYTSVIEVVDSYGEGVDYDVRYEILENQAPEVLKDIDDKLFEMAGQKFSLDMSDYLYDPDGEQLDFDIKVTDNTVLHLNPSGNVLHATTLAYGMTDVTIIASDSRGLECTLTFKVAVKDPSTPVSLYPNPVTDYLNISTMDVAQTKIRIVSSTGKTVYDETGDVSAFYPAKIDMTSCAPGVYDVSVMFDGETYRRTVVKL